MPTNMFRLTVQQNRLLSKHTEPNVALLRLAAVFAFIAIAAGTLSFTKSPAVAIGRILFFLAVILSLTLLILGIAARRK